MRGGLIFVAWLDFSVLILQSTFVDVIAVVLAPRFADCTATRPEFRLVTDLDVLFDSSTVAERKMS